MSCPKKIYLYQQGNENRGNTIIPESHVFSGNYFSNFDLAKIHAVISAFSSPIVLVYMKTFDIQA